MIETSRSEIISTKLARIAKLSREKPQMVWTTLAHHIDVDWLCEAFARTRKNGATGVDRQTAREYELHLEDNLRALLERVHAGQYRAPPVRRVYIPKGTKSDRSNVRPIGIPTFEDKVLQRAVLMLLEAVYEQDFLDCSYGFRPGRSAHDALSETRERLKAMGGGIALEVDIRSYFDTVDHAHLREILRKRVQDGVLLRLIGKWLNAGVWERGAISYPGIGTPQGGVISPLLSNIYLHEALDTWFANDVRPRLYGRAFLVRYADDAVLGFSDEDDARRVMAVLPKRFARYGLALHPEKTRLVDLRHPARRRPNDDQKPRGPRGLDLLGFTLHWAKSPRGSWVLKCKTAAARFRRAVTRTAEWCRNHRHLPVEQQWQLLKSKLLGHYSYFDWPGNRRALSRFRDELTQAWHCWLNRRSQRARMTWMHMKRLMQRYPLPRPAEWRPRDLAAANP
jgi:group II intron reverse transcriptase/maturase